MFDFYDLTLVAAVLAVVEIIGLLLAVDAVMRPRSSQAAIAWSIALVTLPIITIPLYVIFGRTHFLGYAEALREKEGLVGKRLADWFSRMAATAAEPHEGLEAVEDLVRDITRIPFTTNRSIFGLPPGLLGWPRPCCKAGGGSGYDYHLQISIVAFSVFLSFLSIFSL